MVNKRLKMKRFDLPNTILLKRYNREQDRETLSAEVQPSNQRGL